MQVRFWLIQGILRKVLLFELAAFRPRALRVLVLLVQDAHCVLQSGERPRSMGRAARTQTEVVALHVCRCWYMREI